MFEKQIDTQYVVAVVDDNPAVRQLVAGILRMHGYHVLEARCGTDALDVIEQNDRQIDLLLTDIDMPGMDGLSLSRQIRERRPDTRVVFMSGGAMHAGINGEPFLSKPFALGELLATVGDRLSSLSFSCQLKISQGAETRERSCLPGANPKGGQGNGIQIFNGRTVEGIRGPRLHPRYGRPFGESTHDRLA
jgi:CheY-like chemotaxis protein